MNRVEAAAERLKHLSPADFLNLGRSEFVYVRPVEREGKIVFDVHSANGDNLFTHESYAGAVWMAKQNNFHPFHLQ